MSPCINHGRDMQSRTTEQGDGSVVSWGSPFAGGDTSEACRGVCAVASEEVTGNGSSQAFPAGRS